jgi:hypothetical protein
VQSLKSESDISKEKNMKQDKPLTFGGTKTTSSDVCHWVQTLFRLHERLAPRFARPEPYRRVLAYLQGMLSDTARKNGWQLAEHAGEARPDGMQRLLWQAVWDTEGVRDDLRSSALERLGQEDAHLAIDETCFRQQRPKIGRCGPAVVRNHGPGGELSGRSLSLVCEGQRPYPD